MSIQILLTNTEQGLIYSLVALGLYISYRTLDIADLTTDGSFTLGIACSAILTSLGHPVLGLAAALIAGALAGGVTAVLQTKLGVQPILAGIITMTGLYSINLMIMGKSNLTLLRVDTLFRWADGLMPQQQGYGDLTLGTGMVVIGLASLVIGEVLVGRGGIVRGVVGALIGSIIYRVLTGIALTSNLGASNLKLVSAVIVAAAISWPAVRDKILFYKKRKEADKEC